MLPSPSIGSAGRLPKGTALESTRFRRAQPACSTTTHAARRDDAYAWPCPIQGGQSNGADPRVGQVWGKADLDSKPGHARKLWMGRLAGLTFPGWSVGRARLTLNQD